MQAVLLIPRSLLLFNVFADPKGFGIRTEGCLGKYRCEDPKFSKKIKYK